MDIYLEIGTKRVIAGALGWPGWCRSARDEATAIEALLTSAGRYARVIALAGLDFTPPSDSSDLAVVERLAGTDTTDFGAPDVPPIADLRPLTAEDLPGLTALLNTYWAAFDAALAAAAGCALRKGPRGGGREIDQISAHVLEAEQAYLRRRAWKLPKDGAEPGRTRAGVLAALEAAISGEDPTAGPRGGKIWSARYFARRVGYHVLDHIWEIEDRLI